MNNIEREDIQIISRHSNLSEKGIDKILKEQIYNDAEAWQKFLRLFFISLGIGFTTVGVVFFFAYNWADLHKFVKIGLIEGLIIALISIILFSNIKLDIKNILITGASMLVGVLFAVFGQIYQTGANAYDFFLGWTIYTTLWVVVSNFPPLSLLYITLINTTLILYIQQVANDWSAIFIFTLLFLVNVLFLIFFLLGAKTPLKVKSPTWFSNLIALAAISFSTIGIVIIIFDKSPTTLPILVPIAAILYGVGIKYGLSTKSSFYLSVIPFSVIIIISAFLINLSDGLGMFFLVSLFVIVSVTLVIKNLIGLQKKWTNES